MSQEQIESSSGPRSPSSDPERDPEPPLTGTPQSTVSKKRKAEEDAEDPSPDQLLASGASLSDDYSAGRITCETCGEPVSYRDEHTGAFNVDLRNAHKAQCSKPARPPSEPASASSIPEPVAPIDVPVVAAAITAVAAAPPAKRRRAKRTEDERIEYLRSDPYVAKFEPYRVLCASCDKWIRLRPNSTYCSIPWDAHRKSCLSKKGGSKAPTGPRDSALTSDPCVKKFDSDRVHCRYCSKWIPIGSNAASVSTWTIHRDACQQLYAENSTDSVPSVPPPSRQQVASASAARPPASTPSTPARPVQVSKDVDYSTSASASPSPSLKTSPLATSPHGEAQARRRNAEQRAALLRNDPLLSEVEPHRVCCRLCKKWVQLRQDSSYCAYPWQQHRVKCVVRTCVDSCLGSFVSRPAQVLPSVPGWPSPFPSRVPVSHRHSSRSDASLQPRLLFVRFPLSTCRSPHGRPTSDLWHSLDRERKAKKMRERAGAGEGAGLFGVGAEHAGDTGDEGSPGAEEGGSSGKGSIRGMPMDVDVASPTPRHGRAHGRSLPTFADLDNDHGRVAFVLQSVSYLFATTYEGTDDMTIAALVLYLNSAMPPDKYVDFDTGEVVDAVRALDRAGKLALEGDVVRLR
ncbi:hypothetical protein OF83DRAFT_720877 [Amylostereum chailletii]|nr:hypothetical protein OF83DRAFT_720877 [Amylostereum chailletii]